MEDFINNLDLTLEEKNILKQACCIKSRIETFLRSNIITDSKAKEFEIYLTKLISIVKIINKSNKKDDLLNYKFMLFVNEDYIGVFKDVYKNFNNKVYIRLEKDLGDVYSEAGKLVSIFQIITILLDKKVLLSSIDIEIFCDNNLLTSLDLNDFSKEYKLDLNIELYDDSDMLMIPVIERMLSNLISDLERKMKQKQEEIKSLSDRLKIIKKEHYDLINF